MMYHEPAFSNIQLDPDTYYFLYVGELKACCLNPFLQKGLERETGRKVGHISVVQDMCEANGHNNIMILNPEAVQLAVETDGSPKVAIRVPMRQFAIHVSQHPAVRNLVHSILLRQPALPVWMFENKVELTLRDIPGVQLLGPDPSLVFQCNDKAWQYDTFFGLVPTVDYKICCGIEELMLATSRMRENSPDGVFVSKTYSAGGSDSMVTHSQEETSTRFNDPYARYLVSPYIKHAYDPTVLGLVANANDVFIAGVADMRIEGGTGFRGSTWPSQLPEHVQSALRKHTKTIGHKLGEYGFRGIFGCDYIVDHSENIYFIEVNPRKQGTTMEFTCMLEQLSPADAPSLIELEYYAFKHGRFPNSTAWPDFKKIHRKGTTFHWGTYNFKVNNTVKTHTFLPQAMPEVELFRRCAKHGQGGYLILEHVGRDTVVKPGTFLARAVAVDSTRQGMRDKLEHAIQLIKSSFEDNPSAPEHVQDPTRKHTGEKK